MSYTSMATYGYIRVSSIDQSPNRQINAMKERGILEENIFVDKMSGKDFERPAYKMMLDKLRADDLIVIKCIDRLGRNYDEILKQWRHLTKVKNVNLEVLDMPLLNTTVEHDGLTGVFISDMVLQVLAYVAETERTFIKQRQSEGIQIALANGVHFGRTELTLPPSFKKAYLSWLKGDISTREGAKIANMSHTTFYRRCKERQNRKIS